MQRRVYLVDDDAKVWKADGVADLLNGGRTLRDAAAEIGVAPQALSNLLERNGYQKQGSRWIRDAKI